MFSRKFHLLMNLVYHHLTPLLVKLWWCFLLVFTSLNLVYHFISPWVFFRRVNNVSWYLREERPAKRQKVKRESLIFLCMSDKVDGRRLLDIEARVSRFLSLTINCLARAQESYMRLTLSGNTTTKTSYGVDAKKIIKSLSHPSGPPMPMVA